MPTRIMAHLQHTKLYNTGVPKGQEKQKAYLKRTSQLWEKINTQLQEA
jgi:hypothetical protein